MGRWESLWLTKIHSHIPQHVIFSNHNVSWCVLWLWGKNQSPCLHPTLWQACEMQCWFHINEGPGEDSQHPKQENNNWRWQCELNNWIWVLQQVEVFQLPSLLCQCSVQSTLLQNLSKKWIHQSGNSERIRPGSHSPTVERECHSCEPPQMPTLR